MQIDCKCDSVTVDDLIFFFVPVVFRPESRKRLSRGKLRQGKVIRTKNEGCSTAVTLGLGREASVREGGSVSELVS